MPSATRGAETYLQRIRRRAWAFIGVRALVSAVAVAALTVALAAVVLGPLPARPVAFAAIAAAVVFAVVSAWRQTRRAAQLRGPGVTGWLVPLSPELASRARSVLELSAAGDAQELVRAHRQQVERDLWQLPLRDVAPASRELPPRLLLLLLGALTASALLLGSTRGRAGAYGLVHAFEASSNGARRADLVSVCEATLRFPAYRGREPLELRGADTLELPQGTAVAYRVRFHRVPTRAALELPGGEVRLSPIPAPPGEDAGAWFGAEFVANQSGPLSVLVRAAEGDEWARDRRARSLRVLADAAPVASLSGPPEGDIPLDLPTRVGFAATDDVGVTEVSLLIARPDGTEERRRLAAHPSGDQRALVQGSTELTPLDLGARAGDVITVTLLASDGDVLTGPHVTRSEPLSMRVASASARRQELLAGLDALLGLAIDTLGERLSTPLEREDRSDATDRARHTHLAGLERSLVRSLRTYASAADQNASTFTTYAQQLERGIELEARAYGGARAAAGRARADAEQTTRLENLVLALDEQKTMAGLADAAEIARELLALRRELASLLAELRRADTEEARRAVAAAIARARDRLAQLSERAAQIDPSIVPPEFANQVAGQREANDALEDLERALASDDLEGADRSMHDLERQIDQLIASLGQAEEEYSEEHFGARDRALAEALDALNGLETEQRLLAERTDRTRRAAAARALESATDADSPRIRRLQAELEAARDALRDVPEAGIGVRDRDTLSRARQRLLDAQDALNAGDLGETRRMVAEARGDALGLSRDLELSALMFGGAGGRTADAAERMGAAARRVAGLEGHLDSSIPDLREHLEANESTQLREDSARQQRAEAATEGLATRFRDGPGGEALSEDAAAALDVVRRQMSEAERALRRLDAVGAGARQAEAAEALRELREHLEEQSRGGGGGGSNGGSGGGGGAMQAGQRVAIPTAEDHEGPAQFRRRVMDAMERRAPGGLEDATRRYYERLLR